MDSYRIVSHPSGDWEGLYKNGELIDEGHSGMDSALISLLSLNGTIDFDEYEGDIQKEAYKYEDDEYEAYPSNMPDKLPKELE